MWVTDAIPGTADGQLVVISWYTEILIVPGGSTLQELTDMKINLLFRTGQLLCVGFFRAVISCFFSDIRNPKISGENAE